MKYLVRKLWPLLVLLLVSSLAAIAGTASEVFRAFSKAYLRFAAYVVGVGSLFGAIGALIPRNFDANAKLFRCRNWEKSGRIYDTVFRIRKWKDRLFDLSRVMKLLEKKELDRLDHLIEKSERLIQETCVAELIHWILLIISPSMFIACHNMWMIIFWIFYVCLNLMDIMIQRYNRPRLMKVVKRKQDYESCNSEL